VSDPSRLRLFQLVSPALPVGAFSYSEGLEVLVQAGQLDSVAALQAWLQAELQRGAVAMETAALSRLQVQLNRWRSAVAAAGPSDPAALAARAELLDLDGWLLAQREAPELRAQQRQMGQSLLQLLADLGFGLPASPPARSDATAAARARPGAALAWPAAFAWASCSLELAAPAVEEAYLYGWVANQISAAVRLVPLGPTQGQRLQLLLGGLIAQRAEALAAADPRSLWNGGVGAGLAQLQHAELYSRLFRS
jgi:urease accessory protein